MKKILLISMLFLAAAGQAQTNCANALPFCAGGTSGVTFPASTSITAAQTGPNYGCLGSTPNPAWYYLQIGQSGNLDILIQGQIASPPGPGQDVDFICWGPFNSLAGICNSLTASNIVDCSYSGSFTETLNIPTGVTGQYYMVLITNFANIQQNIVFTQIGGTGDTDCSLLTANYKMCIGTQLTMTTQAPSGYTGVTYSLNPGGLTSSTPSFVVSPTVTTTYTFYATGTNNVGTVMTRTATSNVTVNPQPAAAPTITQTSCTSTVNGYNLNLTFSPVGATPSYSINWLPVPNGIPNSTVTSFTGNIAPGNYNATITAAGGCSTTVSFSISPVPDSPLFTFSPSGPYILTCANPGTSIDALNANDSFTWTNGQIAPVTGSNAAFNYTTLGTWTVSAVNNVSGCTATKTFVVSQNTVAPTAVLSPSYQVINCTMTAVSTVSATSNVSVNITHQFISPQGGVYTANNVTGIYVPGGPGTYTHVLTNNINGCSTTREFTVFSNQGYPVFNVSSPQNYTLGCNTKSVVTLNILGANTTPTGGAVSYTLLGPSSPTILPPGPLGGISSYTVTSPGTWILVTRDNVSFCDTKVPVSVITNTMGPSIDTVAVPYTVLSCATPSMVLEGVSQNTNTSYAWQFPGTPGTQPGNTLAVSVVTSKPTNTLISNFTLSITDNNNTCVSRTVVPIYQNIFPPRATISNGGTASLTCNTGTVLLSNMSTSGIPPNTFPSGDKVIGYLWEGPTPEIPLQVSSSYLGSTVGVYTMTAMDLNNGCTSMTTIAIGDNRIYPVVNQDSLPPSILDCGSSAATVTLQITSDPQNLIYTWIPPAGAATAAPAPGKLLTDKTGTYKVVVTNTVNGCASSGEATVIGGELKTDFEPSVSFGYAPLTVMFTNQSASSNSASASNSITSVWNLGNGTSSLTTSSASQVSATYNQPGTYRVQLFSAKGACLDTAVKFITVEVPSELVVPNVFSPNGDNVNDIFFLKTANVESITMSIFDRWGHKVYEVSSGTGNVAWDGKNRSGDDAAEGTYFYILQGKGRDGQSYDSKGTISLFR